MCQQKRLWGQGRKKREQTGGGWGGCLQWNVDTDASEKATPLILNYCLNIPYIPIMRFDTKIEISTEFCLWKHNSEKAHVPIKKPGRRGTTQPSRIDHHPQLCIFPSARFQDTVGKNRPLILKIYSTQHKPGFSM